MTSYTARYPDRRRPTSFYRCEPQRGVAPLRDKLLDAKVVEVLEEQQQEGSINRVKRAKGFDVWVYRWRELQEDGQRVQRKTTIGDAERWGFDLPELVVVEWVTRESHLSAEFRASRSAAGTRSSNGKIQSSCCTTGQLESMVLYRTGVVSWKRRGTLMFRPNRGISAKTNWVYMEEKP